MNTLCSSLALFVVLSSGRLIGAKVAHQDGDRVGYFSIERSMELPSTLNFEGAFQDPMALDPRYLEAGKRITGVQGDDGNMALVGWSVRPRPDLFHAYPPSTIVRPSTASAPDRARMPDIAMVIEDLRLSWISEEPGLERSERQQAWLAAAFGCAGVPAGREFLQDMEGTDADMPPRLLEIMRGEEAMSTIMRAGVEQYFDTLAACLFDEAVAMGEMTGDVEIERSARARDGRRRVRMDVYFKYASPDPLEGDLALLGRREVHPLLEASLQDVRVWLRLTGYGDVATSSSSAGPVSWRINCYAELSWNLCMETYFWGAKSGRERNAVGAFRGIVSVTGTDRTKR